MSRVFRTFEDYKKHPKYQECLDEWSKFFITKLFEVMPKKRFDNM